MAANTNVTSPALGLGGRPVKERRSERNSRSRAVLPSLWSDIFGGVQWDPAYIAFLYYLFVVVTYWLPGADIAMGVALAMLLLRPGSLRLTPSLVWFGGFAAWSMVCYLASPYQGASWEQAYTILKLWLIAFTAVNVVQTRAQLRLMMGFLVGCFVLFPMRGAFVNYLGGYNVFGRALWNFQYANPNDLAAFAILFCAIAAALFFLLRARLARAGVLSAAGGMLVLILFTQSRGALVALAVVLLVVLFGRRGSMRVRLSAAALITIAAFTAPDSVWERVTGLTKVSVESGMQGVDKEGSAEQRFQIMKVAARVAADNPVFGVGPGAYSTAHPAYQRTMQAEAWFAAGNRDAHSTYLRTAAELGLIGLALFLGMVVSAIVRCRKAQQRELTASGLFRFMRLGLITFLLAGLFGSFAYLNVLYITLALIDAAINTNSSAAPSHASRLVRSRIRISRV